MTTNEQLIQQWLKGNTVKKLPQGEAVGARDLERWAKRRANGLSGSGEDRSAVCRDCGKVFEGRQKDAKRCLICNAKRWRKEHPVEPYKPTGLERVVLFARHWNVVEDHDGVMATVPYGWPKHKSRLW